ncbi:MAG TPA: hypothetical protein DET40_13270 [Lentisphaeria bacterium]|nr:MAG: hypothetical protein A2X45_01415 [Lentisphaerae bacterium GWF2_50_93]HCE44511.1 hypothetical protein [Lentisphaeria bacterium]
MDFWRPAGKIIGLSIFAIVLFSASSGFAGTDDKVCTRCGDKDCEYMLGVNWAGAEFAPGSLPGVEGKNFGWPTAESLDYWKSKDVKLIRLPFLWERLQPELNKDFDPTYCDSLKKSVKMIRDRNMVVILDVHNYAKYKKSLIGSEEVPVEAFADLWRRLAEIFNNDAAVWGYGLMNEPNGKCDWPKAAQAAIDAIRSADKQTRIFVANDYAAWSATRADGNLADWAEKSLKIPDPSVLKDPSNKLRFELHTYFDHDNSGTYKNSYDKEITRKDGPEVRVGPDVGIARNRPFVEWLKKHKVKGFIGEYCAPANPGVDERWLVTLDKTMAYLDESCIPSTFWSAGTCWTPGSKGVIEPHGWSTSMPAEERKQDRPQLKIIQKYMRTK